MMRFIAHRNFKSNPLEFDFARLPIIRPRINEILRMVLFSLIWVFGSTVMAQSPTENGNKTQLPVEITADELISHGNKNYAEFVGNVAAIQGNFSIHSDALRIYYLASGADISTDAAKPESLEKIVAIGNVVIKAESRRAETERAEYSLKEDKVVLSGENSTVSDGKNTLTGSKITWHRNTGQISVEGSEQKRVKAVFYSTEGLTLPTQSDSNASESPKSK